MAHISSRLKDRAPQSNGGTVFIKWNKTNIHALGSHDGKQVYWLRPGWNEFPEAIWKLYEKDSEILGFLEDKTIEVLAERVTTKNEKGKTVTQVIGKGDAEVHIKALDEKKAIEIVKATFNRNILQRWLDEETRHKVKRALDAQLNPLLPQNKAG